MRGLAGAVMIEQQCAFVEERGLRRVEVFRLGAGLHRPPAEGNDAPAPVVNRKHHPVAEPVVGHGDVGPMHEEARLDHLLDAHAFGGEPVAQGEALGGRIPEREALLHSGAEAAVGEVAARFGADRLLQVRLEQTRRHAHDFDEARALLLVRRLGVAQARHGEAGHSREPLDRLGEAQALGLHEEGEDVAVLAGREVVEEALLVVDEERRRLLRGERRERRPFAPSLTQFDPRADHFRHRQPGADLVEKGGREFHARQIGPTSSFGKTARALSPAFAGAGAVAGVDDPGRRDRRLRLQGAAAGRRARLEKLWPMTVAYDRLHVTHRDEPLMASASSPKPSRVKVREHRNRLREQGLRPIQIWAPDVRSPAFRKEAHRQSVAASAHAFDDQAFIDAVSDLGE